MKLEALDHPKTLDLAARLEIDLPTAIGHLELLWAFTGKKAPQGNIGKWPDGAIARACFWMGRPETFILALCEVGYLDAGDAHRLTIHDWHEHAPRWVKSKLKSLGLGFILDTSQDVSPDEGGDVSRDVSGDTKGREGKGSTSTREGKGVDVEAPPDLDPAAWKRWIDYRIEIRKPIKSVSIPAAQRQLAGFGADQAAVVEQSIANGWQGIFELKAGKDGKPPRGRTPPNDDAAWAEARTRAKAIGFRDSAPHETAASYMTQVKQTETRPARTTIPAIRDLASKLKGNA